MSVAKEFHRLYKRVGKLTDGQASIEDIDWEDGMLTCFHVIITPNYGLYKGGKFKFEIKIPNGYPENPPVVWCYTDIYHPNIDPTETQHDESSTNVCLNVLEHGTWSSSFGLEGAILGLLFLMHNPNLQDPLSPHFEGADDEEYFQANVKKYMAGEEFDDMTFNKDFIVIEGILIEESVTADKSVTKTEATDEIENEPEDQKEINDGISVDDNMSEKCDSNVNGSVWKEISENSESTLVNADISKAETNEEHIIEVKAECSSNSNSEKIELTLHFQVAGNIVDNEEECDDCAIELVNVDGDCVLLIHRCAIDEDEINGENTEQDSDTTEEIIQNELVSENLNSLREISNLNANEINSELEINSEELTNAAKSLTATDNGCNSEDNLNKGACYQQLDCSGNKALITDLELDADLRNKFNQENDRNFGCGAWYTFRTAVSKIVHTIGHNKLYRDLGF